MPSAEGRSVKPADGGSRRRKRLPSPRVRPTKKAGASRPFPYPCEATMSVACGDRAAPAEAIVYAQLDGMFVIPEAGADDRGGPGGKGGVAEIVKLVLAFDGPVRREQVFEAGTHGITIPLIAAGRESRRKATNANADIVVAAPGVAALGVEQRRAEGVAKPGRGRAKLVGVPGDQSATRENHPAAAVPAEPAILGLGTDHPVGCELVIEAALHATQEPGVTSTKAVVARERPADMAANIEAGPVVDRFGRRVDRSFRVGARPQIGGERGTSEDETNGCTEQKFFHENPRYWRNRHQSNNVAPVWLLRGNAGARLVSRCDREATTPICSAELHFIGPNGSFRC